MIYMHADITNINGNNLTYKINVRYQCHWWMGGGYQKTLNNKKKEGSLMVKILVLQCRGEERKSTLESASKVCEVSLYELQD